MLVAVFYTTFVALGQGTLELVSWVKKGIFKANTSMFPDQILLSCVHTAFYIIKIEMDEICFCMFE